MKQLTWTVFAAALLGLFIAGAAFAQESNQNSTPDSTQGSTQGSNGQPGEVTITVFEENQEPQFDKKIELPKTASDTGVKKSQDGLDRANEARDKNRAFGRERASEENRENMREEHRANMREQVRDGVVPPVDREMRRNGRDSASDQPSEMPRERNRETNVGGN